MHVFLTGASAGIGEGLAYAFAGAGYDVTLVARRENELERVAERIRNNHGRRAFVLPADLTQLDAIGDLLARAREELGRIDILINNAGAQVLGPTDQIDVARYELMLTINVLAPFRLTGLVLPEMIEHGSGCIVDISSLSGLAPTPGMFHYSASKAALAAASEALRAEARRYGVHVVTVYPGPVETDMAQAALTTYDDKMASRIPIGTTEGLAKLVLKAVQKRRKRVIYPRVYGLIRRFPNLTRWIMDTFAPIPERPGGK